MTIGSAIMQGIIALGVVGALGWLIFIKIAKNNPKAAETIRNIIPTNLYDKTPISVIPDKIEQVYDERRTMM